MFNQSRYATAPQKSGYEWPDLVPVGQMKIMINPVGFHRPVVIGSGNYFRPASAPRKSFIHRKIMVELVATRNNNEEDGRNPTLGRLRDNHQWEQQQPFDFSSKLGWD